MTTVVLPNPIGFVLGGGGSRGAAQVGMLQALAGAGIVPDLVTGTSVGSLNGAFLAAEPTGAAARLSHLWADIDKEDIFPGSALRSVRTLRTDKVNLYQNHGLASFIGEHLPVGAIDELSVPFAAMATDVDTGAAVALDHGDLRSALLASTAIPGVFPPIERDGRLLYAGGIVDNVPVRQALAMGARSLVVLDCAFPGHAIPRPTRLREVIAWASSVGMRSQLAADLPHIAASVPVLYLPGPPPSDVSPLEFESTTMLMSGAYEASQAFLDGVVIDGPGLHQHHPSSASPDRELVPANVSD